MHAVRTEQLATPIGRQIAPVAGRSLTGEPYHPEPPHVVPPMSGSQELRLCVARLLAFLPPWIRVYVFEQVSLERLPFDRTGFAPSTYAYSCHCVLSVFVFRICFMCVLLLLILSIMLHSHGDDPLLLVLLTFAWHRFKLLPELKWHKSARPRLPRGTSPVARHDGDSVRHDHVPLRGRLLAPLRMIAGEAWVGGTRGRRVRLAGPHPPPPEPPQQTSAWRSSVRRPRRNPMAPLT